MRMRLNHTNATNVTRGSIMKAIWRNMKQHTLMGNHTNATNVTRSAQKKAIWRNMNQHTLMKSPYSGEKCDKKFRNESIKEKHGRMSMKS